MTTAPRLNWTDLSAPWRSCISEAWASYCAGSVPIGAVVIDAAGSVVATGRNQRKGTGDGGPLEGHLLAHAEMNALLAACDEHGDLRGCTLLTTVEPCPLCTGAAAMSHIGRIEFAARDLWAGGTDLLQATAYMRSKQVEVVGPIDSHLEEMMLAWNVDYWLRQPPTAARQRLIGLWRVAFPHAVEAGELLYERDTLAVPAAERWLLEKILPLVS